MMSRLERSKRNTKLARMNIVYHIGNAARRNGVTVEDAVTTFLTAVRVGTASAYLIGASKIADSENDYLSHKRVVRWVNQWQRDIPQGQHAKKNRNKQPMDLMEVAIARETVIKHILAVQDRRRSSAGKEINHLIKRLHEARLPDYLRQAIKTGHGKPGNRNNISIARCTIYEWMRIYKNSGMNVEALKPIPSSVPKPKYANDNVAGDRCR